MTTMPSSRPPLRAVARADESHQDLVRRVHEQIIQKLDVRMLDALSPDESRRQVELAVATIIADMAPSMAVVTRQAITEGVVHEVLGFGPIQPLLDDPEISEVMVNAPDAVYYEKDGVLFASPIAFRDVDHIRRIADRIVAPLGRRLDETAPMVDARLPNGSRVNIVIAPIAVKSPMITIRKFQTDRFDVEDLIRIGTLTPQVAGFLRASIISKINVVISGGTGSGKTTLLNALSAFIPRHERIVTVEDPLELQLRQPHVLSLEARPPTGESSREFTQRDLVRNALRMRPDRILVGEVRGIEAFDMLQAMNTGHEGSLTTVHANSPRDALSRIENMVMMAGLSLPERAIREQMGSALHLIVQISRLTDGSRRVTHITEVSGLEGEVITLQDIFRFEGQRIGADGHVDGKLVAMGIRPAFAEKFVRAGVSEVWMGTPERARLS
ncbi:MAG: CpaF family protein [Dehalococcoidia bacterium]|nr:MAG: CpaF family protein [Dehalococcoidia bacterium]